MTGTDSGWHIDSQATPAEIVDGNLECDTGEMPVVIPTCYSLIVLEFHSQLSGIIRSNGFEPGFPNTSLVLISVFRSSSHPKPPIPGQKNGSWFIDSTRLRHFPYVTVTSVWYESLESYVTQRVRAPPSLELHLTGHSLTIPLILWSSVYINLWKDPPFLSWENAHKNFRLGHFPQ